MGVLLIFIVAFLVIFAFLFYENHKDKGSDISKRSRCLYMASNRNTYTKAREVFKILKDAEVEPQFLGGYNE